MGNEASRDSSSLAHGKNLGFVFLVIGICGLAIVTLLASNSIVSFLTSLFSSRPPDSVPPHTPLIEVTKNPMPNLSGDSVGQITGNSSAKANISEAQSANTSRIDRENYSLLSVSPDDFAGAPVQISGKVYALEDMRTSERDVLSIKMHVDTTQGTGVFDAIVFYDGFRGSAPDSKPDSCLMVSGTVRGGLNEVSPLGKSIIVPTIDSSQLLPLPCIDSEMPAYKSVNLEKSETLNGIEVVAKQVQYSQDAVRLQVTIINQNVGGALYLKEASVTQNGTRFESLSGIPSFESYQITKSLQQGEEKNGFLFFRPVSSSLPSIFTIVMEKPAVSGPTESTFIFTMS